MGLDMYLYKKEINAVAYWRKSNAIHGWIINRTNAIDDCTPIQLCMEDLVELLGVCKEISNDPSKAQELLPPTPGFFFGSTEIDEWYMYDIESTIEKLTKIINQSVDDTMFEYHASW
jgi:hypothetical protein